MTSIFAVSAIAAFLVGMSKGGLPSIGALAVPLIALVMPPLVGAALLLPIFLISDVVGLYLYRRQFSREHLTILAPAGLIGVLIGWAFGGWLSAEVLGLLVGVIGIIFCMRMWFGKWLRTSPVAGGVVSGVIWGSLSGVTSFISHSGGPTYQMYILPQQLPKMVFAGTTTIFFAIVNFAKIVPYWALGMFPEINIGFIVALAPVALLGTVAGKGLTGILPDWIFFRIVEVALLVLSVKLIGDYLAGGASY